jgi:hypothetical protein
VYAEHQQCKLPADLNLKVWRYVDLGKLLDLLESRSLFFPLMSVLVDADPYEGFLGEATIAEIRRRPDMDEKSKQTLLKLHEDAKKLLYVSCWHMNEQESAAMWSLYIRGGEGLAIQTTVKRLMDSFAVAMDIDVSVGEVQYIDYRSERIGWANIFAPVLRKRASFAHEHELRAIVARTPKVGDQWGARVPIRVEDLIERIVMAPTAPAWLGGLVDRIMHRLGYQFPVERSPLFDRPVY